MKKLFIILLIFSTKLNAQVVSKMIELGYDKETIQTYEKSSKPTFLIQLEGKENYESVGNSRIGGVPDLPKNLDYPTVEEDNLTKHYVFIAQINLSELPHKEESIFPKKGMLYFFIHNDEESMSKVKHLVLYANTKNKSLKKYKVSENITYTGSIYDKPFPAQKISFKQEKSIDLHHLEDNQQDLLQANDKYFDVFKRATRFGGHHYSVDGIIPLDIIQELEILPYEETSFLTRGFLNGEKTYAKSNQKHFDFYEEKIKESKSEEEIVKYKASIQAIKEKIEFEKKLFEKREYYIELLDKWELMLAITSLDECEMLWWDSSILEFYINMDDLKKADFSKTFAIINH